MGSAAILGVAAIGVAALVLFSGDDPVPPDQTALGSAEARVLTADDGTKSVVVDLDFDGDTDNIALYVDGQLVDQAGQLGGALIWSAATAGEHQLVLRSQTGDVVILGEALSVTIASDTGAVSAAPTTAGSATDAPATIVAASPTTSPPPPPTTAARTTTAPPPTTTTTSAAPPIVNLMPISAVATNERAPIANLRCGGSNSFEAELLIDGDLDTGWGASSTDGSGQSIRLDFGREVRLTQVGLTPGYARLAPRFSEGCAQRSSFTYNRFVESVRYEFDDGSFHVQTFRQEESLQRDSVEVTTRFVTIVVISTTRIGSDDDTIMSEAAFSGWTE